jgi:NO-binding membrane sensor protein with MHYT domain
MHFVGNRAIILGDGRRSIQLYYNPGYTALSAIIPIIFLFFGFLLAERKVKNTSVKMLYVKTVGCGIIAGIAIMGMHYIGNFGTDNYDLYNRPACIIGAAVISMSACTFALTLFFHQKEHWINQWWRRWICACVLAAAVSGMHWVASIGTTYQLKSFRSDEDNSLNNNLIVAVAMVRFLGISVL